MERPIIFNDAMSLAVIEGRKTVTRRPVKPQPIDWTVSSRDGDEQTVTHQTRRWGRHWVGPDLADLAALCPFGVPGDKLWVREAWRVDDDGVDLEYRTNGARSNIEGHGGYVYEETVTKWKKKLSGGKWAPSVHMPRWASRTVLDVLDVRVERLQSMSEEDARAEGFESRAAFCGTWDAIYPTMGMRHNPWVWVIEFRRAT